MDYFLFILTFASVSLLPGLCMSLAFSLGVSLGYKKTLWMMLGELVGLGIVVLICGFGAHFVLQYDFAFKIFKILAALYLFYIAFILLRTNLSLKEITITQKEKFTLISQGFFTAVSNPKAWIFMLSLLPPFLKSYSDLFLLTLIILMIEFIVLSLYAAGGSFLRKILNEHIKKLNKFSALCVAILGLSLLFEL